MSDIEISFPNNFLWSTSGTSVNSQQRVNLSFVPDAAIVRQISFMNTSPSTDYGMYLVQSSLTNSFIGNFMVANNTAPSGSTVGESMFVSNPQTLLTGIQSTPNYISFSIQEMLSTGLTSPASLTGYISVQIDFVQYWRR